MTTKFSRSALFWVISRRIVVIPCRRFGTTYRSRLQGSWRCDRLVVPRLRQAIATVRWLITQNSADLILVAAEVWTQQRLCYCCTIIVWGEDDGQLTSRSMVEDHSVSVIWNVVALDRRTERKEVMKKLPRKCIDCTVRVLRDCLWIVWVVFVRPHTTFTSVFF